MKNTSGICSIETGKELANFSGSGVTIGLGVLVGVAVGGFDAAVVKVFGGSFVGTGVDVFVRTGVDVFVGACVEAAGGVSVSVEVGTRVLDGTDVAAKFGIDVCGSGDADNSQRVPNAVATAGVAVTRASRC